MKICAFFIALAFLPLFSGALGLNFSSSVLAPEEMVSVSKPSFPALISDRVYYAEMTFNLTVPSGALVNFLENELVVGVSLDFSSKNSPAYFFDFERTKRSFAFNLTCRIENGRCVFEDFRRVGIYAFYSGNSSNYVEDRLDVDYEISSPVADGGRPGFFDGAREIFYSLQKGASGAFAAVSGLFNSDSKPGSSVSNEFDRTISSELSALNASKTSIQKNPEKQGELLDFDLSGTGGDMHQKGQNAAPTGGILTGLFAMGAARFEVVGIAILACLLAVFLVTRFHKRRYY